VAQISFPASWASVTPRDAGIAKQALALQMGGLTPDLLFTSGMENPTSTPVLCKSLAMLLDGMFLSPANHMVHMGHEEVGAFLAVVRLRLAPDRPSQPFCIVLGAPSVPWDFEINTGQALGADAPVGHGRLVPCPPMSYPM